MAGSKKLETWFNALSTEEKTRLTSGVPDKTRLDQSTRDSLAAAGVPGETSDEQVLSFLKSRLD
jgi:hypothetical protein